MTTSEEEEEEAVKTCSGCGNKISLVILINGYGLDSGVISSMLIVGRWG
jgi:hypothetical protein